MNRLVATCVLATAACAVSAMPAGAQERHPRAQAALAQAKRAITQPPAAHAPAELTPALIRLSQALPRLEGRQRRAANHILARPDEPGDPDEYAVPEAPASPACDATFCVHWVAKSPDRPSPEDSNGTSDGDGVPDYVEDVLATAATSFAVENTNLDWVEPLGDGTRGGGPGVHKTDAYLLEFNGRYFGYSAPDTGQSGAVHKRAYVALDNDYAEFAEPGFTPLEALQVTFAHEYNHVLQFTYDSLEDLWMFEATATWMEEQVYQDIDDYLNYLPAFAGNSRVPLTGNNANGLKIYGAAVWNHFLAPSEVRTAWENSDDAGLVHPRHLSVAAYDSALLGSGDNPFAVLGATFIDFASATAEWRAQPLVFPDAADQPNMKRTAKLKRGRSREITLDHLSYVLADVPTRLARRGLKLRVRAPEGTRTGIDLVGRKGSATDGSVTSTPLELPSGGRGSVSLSADEYDRVTAVIVNADARVSGGQYTRNGQHFRVKLVRPH